MLDHHLQRSIVYRLAFAPSLRFSELKPDVVENKLFTYHLKKVEAAGYVEKGSDGTYALTPEGRRMGLQILHREQNQADRAESVLFLVIRRKQDGAWLLYKRKTHPLLGKVGFMHATPNAQEAAIDTAAKTCHEMTGISGQFKALGSGFFRVYSGKDLESFTHFTLLGCDDAGGELVNHDEFALYYWAEEPDFTDEIMLPNMKILSDLYLAGKPFFIDQTLQV